LVSLGKFISFRNAFDAFDSSDISTRWDFSVKESSEKNYAKVFSCQIFFQLYYSCRHSLSAFSGEGGLRY
jgi:hypothetical protein